MVYAPRDGLITDLRVDQGNYAAAGAALMTFIAVHDSWIQADLTENNLGNVKEGDRVEFTFDVRPGKVFKGTVRQTGLGSRYRPMPWEHCLPSIISGTGCERNNAFRSSSTSQRLTSPNPT